METRMALVERWQATHEQVCARRWGTLINLITWGGGIVVALMLSIAGWGLTKTWEGQQEQMRMLRMLQITASAPAKLP